MNAMRVSAGYTVIHETSYHYDSPVSLSRQQLHLTPRDCAWQRCLAHAIVIEPEPTLTLSRLDHFSNPVRQFAIEALAIHHEHRARDLHAARELALFALEEETASPRANGMRHRLARLDRKLAGKQNAQLFQ